MTAKPVLVCMGDLHLTHLIWFKHKDIRDDALVAFTELVDRALEYRVPLVLVGDLNDSVNPPSDITKFIRKQMDRCAEARVPVFFIEGNHDKRPEPWSTALSDWPVHIGHGEVVEINGVTVAGLDYALAVDIERNLAELSQRPLPRILFLHQAVKQGLGFDGAWNCDLDWVPDGIPLVVMGDLHAPADFKLRDGGKALYTGSTHPRNTSEIGSKSFVVINDDLSYARVPFATQRPILREVIADGVPVEANGYVQWLVWAHDQSPLPPVLWLNHGLSQTLAMVDLGKLIEQHAPGAIFIREQRTFSTGSSIQVDVDTSDTPTIPQLVDRVVDPKSEPFAHALVKALTDPKCDPQEVIAAHRAQFLATVR